jgi:DNA primase
MGEDSHRSFSVNVAKRAFRCFSCGARGNQLDLWAAVRRLPLYEATLDLCDRLGETPAWLSIANRPKPAKPDHRLTQPHSTRHTPPQGA